MLVLTECKFGLNPKAANNYVCFMFFLRLHAFDLVNLHWLYFHCKRLIVQLCIAKGLVGGDD